MNSFEDLKEAYPVFQIVVSLIAYAFYIIARRILYKVVLKRALINSFDETRLIYIKKSLGISLAIVLITLLGIIWDLSLKGLSVYIASFITIVGVGLFATWSVVSNITASFILFFFFPIKIGSKVKIVDGDNSVEGTILSVSLFSIKIQNKDGMEIYYPNNLAIQKAIVHILD
ncbi:MAG: mechanosensitive ion channel domain-containing protein [Reichenbachiella sp.]|uniref:mechanosensitive ion channel domain-containing protein n=1 Tax=Reichenbachiella sp. TaxID=2184521 RepID=UPI00326541A4